MLFLCLYCQFWEFLTPPSKSLLVLEQANVCLKPVEATSRLREQRDLYSRHNFEHVSNHISYPLFLLLIWALFVCWVWVFYILIDFRLRWIPHSFIYRKDFDKQECFKNILRNVGYVSHEVFHGLSFCLTFTRMVLLVIIFTI